MFKKIITYFIILTVVLPIFATVVPFGTGVNRAYASEEDRKKEIVSPCGYVAGIFSGSFPECVLFTATYLLYEVGINVSVWITGLASDIFNVSIQFSLTGASFDAEKNKMIKDGWTMVRDLLNLVFIFILLYAAISTILQYGNMDIKKILPGLIVAALLVNFSLMISKVVIDASHVFSWEFYNQIDSTKGGEFKETKGSAEISGDFIKKDLAGVFLAGFNPQRLLIGTSMSKDGVVINDFTGKKPEDVAEAVSVWNSLQGAASIKGESLMDTLWRIIIIIVLEIGLALFASFILFAGAIMFIIRVVILWLIMIFSPIAFLGMILPNMSEYSKMWWKNLIDQAFFAPAFLFMFMLATKFVNADLIDSLLHITPNDTSSIVTGLKMGEILSIIFNFIIVAVLLLACLIVAKKMGGKSAEIGMSLAHKGKNKLLSPGWMLNNRLSNNRLSRWGMGLAGDSNWFAKSVGRIPGGSMLGRKLGSMKKADEDKARKSAEKNAGTLSKAGIKSLDEDKKRGFVGRALYGGGVTEATREGYEKIIEKKKAEKDERKRTVDKYVELIGSQIADFADIEAGENENMIRQKIEDSKKKIEGILIRGNVEELDKLTEEEDRLEEKNNKIKKDVIVEKKRKVKLEISGAEHALNEARKSGSGIKMAEGYLLGLMKDLDDNEKNFAEVITKEKHRENLQKIVDKYAEKQRGKSGKPEEKKEDKKK